jgi:adenylyltransferase/sulfurtransferase
VRFEIDGHEITVFQDARAIVRGTDEVSVARSIYAKYIGT